MENSGVKLWKKAKQIIPGGSQLLSKRSEMFLPDLWPSYYKKAKGVKIWDLDDNEYTDMSIMGIGTCLLGYADEDVNQTVIDAINNGSMSSLNPYEEVDLAEKLIEMHPWAGGVRFARTGGEIVSIAIRLSRAFSKKDEIAFCGYHGWHDWYLSTNLNESSNLEGHLLPGLQPKGVPSKLKDTAFPFTYNNLDELRSILEKRDIGTVIMEPVRNKTPNQDFIKGINKLKKEYGFVLIVDEISSGWRANIPGINPEIGLDADLVTYAKAMSNGFPMAALVGRKEVMDMAEESFISSSYWTSRVGPAASLVTIDKLSDLKVPEQLKSKSKYLKNEWKKIADENEIELQVSGYLPIPSFSFEYENSQAIKTLFNQEMLNIGYLATTVVYLSYPHTTELLNKYISDMNSVFGKIKPLIESGEVEKNLKGGIAHSGFKRLT